MYYVGPQKSKECGGKKRQPSIEVNYIPPYNYIYSQDLHGIIKTLQWKFFRNRPVCIIYPAIISHKHNSF